MSEHGPILLTPTDAAALGPAFLADDKNFPDSPTTPGSILRQARLAQGLNIETMATTLKVPAHKLQALERDQLDSLLDPAFARALASSVCRMLKLDPAPVLQLLPPIMAFKAKSQNRGINEPFRSRESASSLWMGLPFSRSAILLGLALLLGTLVLIFLPTIQHEISRFRTETAAAALKQELVQAVSMTGQPGGGLLAASTSFAAPFTTKAVAPPAAPGFTPGAMPSAAVAPALAVSAEAGSAPALVFSARSESWVRVTDAKGTVVLSRTLAAGEAAEASGALPLLVTIGRADAVQLQVRGHAFDVAAVAKNNIARFEVK